MQHTTRWGTNSCIPSQVLQWTESYNKCKQKSFFWMRQGLDKRGNSPLSALLFLYPARTGTHTHTHTPLLLSALMELCSFLTLTRRWIQSMARRGASWGVKVTQTGIFVCLHPVCTQDKPLSHWLSKCWKPVAYLVTMLDELYHFFVLIIHRGAGIEVFCY